MKLVAQERLVNENLTKDKQLLVAEITNLQSQLTRKDQQLKKVEQELVTQKEENISLRQQLADYQITSLVSQIKLLEEELVAHQNSQDNYLVTKTQEDLSKLQNRLEDQTKQYKACIQIPPKSSN